MGRMLASLTILRKNINTIIIQMCTWGPRSFVALQWSLNNSGLSLSVARSKHLWGSGTLPCWSVESWKTFRMWSCGLILSLSHASFTHKAVPVLLMLLLLAWSSLVTFWVSWPRVSDSSVTLQVSIRLGKSEVSGATSAWICSREHCQHF